MFNQTTSDEIATTVLMGGAVDADGTILGVEYSITTRDAERWDRIYITAPGPHDVLELTPQQAIALGQVLADAGRYAQDVIDGG